MEKLINDGCPNSELYLNADEDGRKDENEGICEGYKSTDEKSKDTGTERVNREQMQ